MSDYIPTMARVGETLRFEWLPLQIEGEVARFREAHGDLTAEVTLRDASIDGVGLLRSGTLNLLSVQTKSSWAKALRERRADVDDWDALIEGMCFMAKEAYRQGGEAICAWDIPKATGSPWLLRPYIQRSGSTVLYAEGGSGKSYLALYLAVKMALGDNAMDKSIAVLYCDWEGEAETFRDRIEAVCRGLDIGPEIRPPVVYERMTVSAQEAAEVIRARILAENIGLVVADSVGMAGGGEPKDASTAISLFSGVRSIGVPALMLAHKNKNRTANDKDRLFGSVFYGNLARLVWEMDSIAKEGKLIVSAAMVNCKRNDGPLLPRHGLSISFENDEHERVRKVTFKAKALKDMPDLQQRIPLWERILDELSRGAVKAPELAEELGIDDHQIRSRLNDLKKQGLIMQLPTKAWIGTSKRREVDS